MERLTASGERVYVSPATHADLEPYRDAVMRSAERIGRWNPVAPHDLVHHLAAQSDKHRTFLIRLNDTDADGEHPLVGSVNVSNVVEGRFMSGTMGYNAFDPYAGQGLLREGLSLVVGIALSPTPRGMGLHRVEANVRPGNAASAGLLRSLGFRRERHIRRMLWLADGQHGPSAWRDHDSFAATREEWPAPHYAVCDLPSGVLVAGEGINVPVLVAVARELGGVALYAVPFEAALAVARTAAAPVLWHAGHLAGEAAERLARDGVHHARVDAELLAATLEPRSVVSAALALRPHLT